MLDLKIIKHMNWGKIIIFTLVAFILFITGMSIYMFASPDDGFDHAYYEKGLNYDKDYNREALVVADHAQPAIKITKNDIVITFGQPAKGEVRFERPSSTAMDHVFPVDGQTVVIPAPAIARGNWQLVFDWKSNGKSYLFNKEIYFK